ncbi:MAG: Holliday junction resolvase RuvX [Bacilli bacterium]
MRYLGFDLGTRTLGLSISDTTHTIASTYSTIRFDGDYDKLLEPLKKIIDKEKIEKIILGLPRNMNYTIGNRGIETIEFKKKLEEYLNIEVIMQDERLSTVEATNYLLEADMSRKKRKKHIDSVAANIILQSYLDKMKGKI